MENKWSVKSLLALTLVIGLLTVAALASAKEVIQQWDLLNPEGVVLVKPIEIAPRLTALEGKSVVLRWNGKPNGDLFLNRIGELLTERIKDIKVVKAWEAAHDTAVISSTPERSREIAAKTAEFKPNIVIASSAD